MTVPLIVAGICLLLEMFFAASEMAVIACDRVGVRKSARDGSRSARLLEAFLANKQRLLATTLAGTQLSVVVSTVVMTFFLRSHHPAHATLYILIALTPTLVVFGEIVPKTIGQQHADWMARRLVLPLWIASAIFTPLVWPLTRFTAAVTRLLKLPEPRKLVTREELELLFKEPLRGGPGEITEGERRMISRIFDFTDKTVHDVMVPLSDVALLPEEASLDEAAREIEEKQYTRFPVFRERVDRIIGTVHAFDVLKAARSGTHMGAIARAPIFVPRSQPAIDLLVELQRARQGMAIVVDEYGGAVGIATVEDILEEVVGEIEDEHDVAPSAIRKEAEGVWRVNARLAIGELNRQLQLGLPEGQEYETLGGLVLERLKHIPREGESLRVAGILIKVIRASDRAIEELELRSGKRRSPGKTSES